MGCGAAKEAADAEPQRGHEPKNDKARDVPQEPLDDRPPLLKGQIFEVYRAGTVKPNVPPLYVPVDAGPFVTREKVPMPHSSLLHRVVVSKDALPARIADEASAANLLQASLNVKLSEDGVLLRAYLPHSLSGYCVGCCRPDLAAGQLVSGFKYDLEVEGAADESAIAQSKPAARDPNQRRRVLLFPAAVDAVALFVTIDGAVKSNRIVAPYRPHCVATGDVEPIDGAFATFSLVCESRPDSDVLSAMALTPRGVPSLPLRQSKREIGTTLSVSPVTFTENSLGFTLLPSPNVKEGGNASEDVERRLPAEDVTPARSLLHHSPSRKMNHAVEAAFAEALCGLDDGPHVVSFSLRFRYVTDTFVAVYDKPAPVAGTSGMRIVGTYVAHTIMSSAVDELSDVIACGDCTLVMDSGGRAHLTSVARTRE